MIKVSFYRRVFVLSTAVLGAALTGCDVQPTAPDMEVDPIAEVETLAGSDTVVTSDSTSGSDASASIASLPTAEVDVSFPATTGAVIRVPAGGDLQAAINRAQPGDVVELQAGAVFRGSFTLPKKTGEGWIVIRSSAWDQLPEGRRVRPEDASKMAKIVGGMSNLRVVRTASGAHHYRLVGLEIALAQAGLPTLVNAIVDFGVKNQTLTTMPHHLILDRSYVHGTPTQNLQRCVILNSGAAAVIDSYLDECHASGVDSQAIVGWNGSGPYRIENNYLAGAAENILFGGAAVGPEGVPPSDIVIRGNHIAKPLSWKGVWLVKNLFELKIAERVLFEGNVLENVWADGQVGFAINLKSENHNKSVYPNLATRDVVIRNNRIINARYGVTVIGGASSKTKTGTGRTSRVVFDNNIFGITDISFQVAGVQGLVIEGNTGTGKVNLEGMVQGFVFRDNLIRAPVKGGGLTEGTVTLETRAPGYDFRGNALVGGISSRYPTGNAFPKSFAAYIGTAGADGATVDGFAAQAVSGL